MNQQCAFCRQVFLPAAFCKEGLKRKRCLQCTRKARAERVNTEEKRLLRNVRAFCRLHRMPEGSCWRLEDVQALLQKYGPLTVEGRKPRLRIVWCDRSRPLLPNNAEVVCFGQGL